MEELLVAFMVVILAVLDLELVTGKFFMTRSATETIEMIHFAIYIGASSIPTTTTTSINNKKLVHQSASPLSNIIPSLETYLISP